MSDHNDDDRPREESRDAVELLIAVTVSWKMWQRKRGMEELSCCTGSMGDISRERNAIIYGQLISRGDDLCDTETTI